MKNVMCLSVLMFLVLLSGCNLITDFLDGGDEEIDTEPLPAEIVILNDSYVLPHDGSSYPIGNTVSETEKIIDFTIKNMGETTLYLYGEPHVLLEGEGFSLIKDAESSILPGNTSVFSVSFLPQAAATYQAVVIVRSNDIDKSPYRFSMSGSGTEIHMAGISIRYGNTIIENGNLLDLGDFQIGNEKKNVFHLKNIGSAELIIEGTPYIYVEGEGFSLVQDAVSPVVPEAEVLYKISFLPSRISMYEGTIRITSNDPEVPDFVYILRGTGIK